MNAPFEGPQFVSPQDEGSCCASLRLLKAHAQTQPGRCAESVTLRQVATPTVGPSTIRSLKKYLRVSPCTHIIPAISSRPILRK